MENTKPTWGGRRAGAGRKKTSPFVAHASRPAVEGRACPVEVHLKLRRSAPTLRNRALLQAFRRASLRARRFGLRILEYRLRRREIFLLCEFRDREQLERSFKSLNTTLAIALKRRFEARTKLAHRGPVFLDRYRLTLLETPLAVKLALKKIVSTDWFHRPDWSAFCSAVNFARFRQLDGRAPPPPRPGAKPDERTRRLVTEIQSSPQFWLYREGWLKA